MNTPEFNEITSQEEVLEILEPIFSQAPRALPIEASSEEVLEIAQITLPSVSALDSARIEFFTNQNEIILGTNNGDRLTGTNANENFVGFDGNDTIVAGGGDDALYGGAGRDILYGGDGNDTFIAEGEDTIIGGAGNDRYLNENNSKTLAFGGEGNDTLDGGKDKDTLFGGAGDDDITGDENDDYLKGGAGDDSVNGERGNDLIFGGAGNDFLVGEDGRDTIFGGEGNDTIAGNGFTTVNIQPNADGILTSTLIRIDPIGDRSIDFLIGGGGSDLFIVGSDRGAFHANAGNEDFAYIKDFRSGEDKIQLAGSSEEYVLQEFSNSQGIYLDSNNNDLVDRSDELIAVVKGSNNLNFDSSDFSFVEPF